MDMPQRWGVLRMCQKAGGGLQINKLYPKREIHHTKIRPEPPPLLVDGTVEANIVKEAQAMLKEQQRLCKRSPK